MERPKTKLLAIDDNAASLHLIRDLLAGFDVEVITAESPVVALEIFATAKPQIVISDAVMPNLSGMDVLDHIVAADPLTDVILLTGHYSTDDAVAAIRHGAADYLTKPLDPTKFQTRIQGLIADAEQRRCTHTLDRELLENYQFEGIVGRSPAMLDVFAKIRRIAPHFRILLIHGATGTGKELVARALHTRSRGQNKTFVPCNCSALVETLVESELFGYVKGAFTGAVQDKMGIFEYGDGGTVFLDEIGDMPLLAQAKLLRVLQNNEVQRVGSPKTYPLDVRIVAATNHDLKEAVTAGKFRQDLYYRLSAVDLSLPRLVDRKEDLPLLLRYFLEKYAVQYKKDISGFSRRAQARLASHNWPGNIRELENVIAHGCMMAETSLVDLKDLPAAIRNSDYNGVDTEGEVLSMEKVQEIHLLKVLDMTLGNKSKAAEILGISRETVYKMLSRIRET